MKLKKLLDDHIITQDQFNDLIKKITLWEIDEVLFSKSALREKANYKWIETIILNYCGIM
jgi:hypothetical protein